MSMDLMVKAMKINVGNPLRKLVLLKLADQANDHGECWPSYQHIADHCETSKRSVMTHVKKLEEDGLIRREYRKGEKGNSTNIFHLTFNKRPSENISPPSDPISPPSENASLPLVKELHPESVSFEPVNESKKNKTKKGALNFSSWPCPPSDPILKDWLEVRKAKKAPLTQTAIDRMANQFHQAAEHGLTVDWCIGLCAERGWSAFKFEWVVNSGLVQAQPTADWTEKVFDEEDPLA
ncbi:transcriptional regulator [Parashewanella curva]|uniref:Transcriptional regulator n=1 Tax=Parashewanella curva TaxID=2338552 RepID=A0A3L8Q028_9GAMM|nr:helix-turn-helix domain-containing protein [Parashewanella curva]RLV60984.1 transcriptional regulator [Parashewanella curva]